jgi:hypothetical protein
MERATLPRFPRYSGSCLSLLGLKSTLFERSRALRGTYGFGVPFLCREDEEGKRDGGI